MKAWWSGLRASVRFGIAGATLLLAGSAAPALGAPDPQKVVGPLACAECHKSEAEIWQGTHHFKTFNALPRNPKAQEIGQKMGTSRLKTDSLCVNCHFTSMVKDGQVQAVAGISCESCHGAGRDYIKVHSSFSGKKKETESPAEAQQRWAAAEAAGMIRTQNLFAIAKNCYTCHIVPQENLVNVGGHQAGSPFELLSWSQGEIRHNTWYNGGRGNAEAPLPTKRKLYVVGAAVELEESLRAVGKATQNGTYAVTMAQRAQAAAQRLSAINQALHLPETEDMMRVAATAKLRLNNNAELTSIADRIVADTRQFVARHDGNALGAIDSMMPGPAQYKGRPVR